MTREKRSQPAPRSSDETVLENLSQRMTVIRERDSAVISIYVRSADAALAAGGQVLSLLLLWIFAGRGGARGAVLRLSAERFTPGLYAIGALAVAALGWLPASKYRDALVTLADFAVARTY